LSQHEGAAEHEAATHEESPWAVVFRWANFAILLGGLGYILRKSIRDFFETRRNQIAEGLVQAQRAQQEAQDRMIEIERRLEGLSNDIKNLRNEAEKESIAEREKILAEARREVERVIEQSKEEIERVARSVERDIKETVADLVLDKATRTLRAEMTQDDHKKVVVRFVKNL
jgi:F-type H+-transporting ATPase subunit b